MTVHRAKLLLLGRVDCSLCDEMAAELLQHAFAQAFELQHGDVDSRPDWQRKYGLRVPVLLDEWNEVVCEGRFDSSAFDQWAIELKQRRQH